MRASWVQVARGRQEAERYSAQLGNTPVAADTPAAFGPGPSPLSMACFIEEIQPEEIPLAPVVQATLSGDLKTLREKPVLEALLYCLEQLSGNR